MAAVALIEAAENRLKREIRIERHLRDRSNPLEDLLPDEVKTRFRFYPETILYIVRILPKTLRRRTQKSRALPVYLQVLVALRFFATGSFYSIVSDSLQVSKTTVWKCVSAISEILASMSNKEICFPSQTAMVNIKTAFYNVAGMPNIVGCVDGTFIKIMKPKENTHEFMCRKGFAALNIQLCCGPDYLIYQSTVKWPGTVNDARIFNNSGLRTLMEKGFKVILLGDSAYPRRHYIFMPYNRVTSAAEERFNTAHKKTRVKIEQTIGILKSRFGCLMIPLCMSTPERACTVTQACIVLHNIACRHRDYIDPTRHAENDIHDEDDDDTCMTDVEARAAGIAV